MCYLFFLAFIMVNSSHYDAFSAYNEISSIVICHFTVLMGEFVA